MPDIDLDSAYIDDAPDDTPAPERTRKPRADKGKPRGPRTGARGPRTSSAKKIADDLLVPWGTLAAGVAMTAPTLSAVMLMRGEKTADALVSIAQKHPRMLKALQKGAESVAMFELAQTGFLMVVAGGMDLGRIPPDAPIAAGLGLDRLYAEVHPPLEDNPVSGYPMGPPAMPPNFNGQWVAPGMPG